MTGLYLFAAATGVPLLAWFLLGGGDDSGGDGDAGGIGGVMFRFLPLSTVAMTLAAFGISGLVLGLTDAGSASTLIAALLAGLIAGALNSTAFAYLRRSESTTPWTTSSCRASVGRVVMPVSADHRGRIAISAGGQQVYLSGSRPARRPADEELEVGAPVLVVEVQRRHR